MDSNEYRQYVIRQLQMAVLKEEDGCPGSAYMHECAAYCALANEEIPTTAVLVDFINDVEDEPYLRKNLVTELAIEITK